MIPVEATSLLPIQDAKTVRTARQRPLLVSRATEMTMTTVSANGYDRGSHRCRGPVALDSSGWCGTRTERRLDANRRFGVIAAPFGTPRIGDSRLWFDPD